MTRDEIIQNRIDNFRKKYFHIINRNNIRIKLMGSNVVIKSSLLRFKIWINLLVVAGLSKIFLLPDLEYLLLPACIFIIYFSYAIWEDIKSINNIKLDLENQKLHIYHKNPLRYLLLKKLAGYKNEYYFNEIKRFNLFEKFHPTKMYSKNYIRIQLINDVQYIILDIPDKLQASIITNFFNDIIN